MDKRFATLAAFDKVFPQCASWYVKPHCYGLYFIIFISINIFNWLLLTNAAVNDIYNKIVFNISLMNF